MALKAGTNQNFHNSVKYSGKILNCVAQDGFQSFIAPLHER